MKKRELLQLINKAASENWEKLDLRRQELTSLPPEIGQLTELTEFNVSENELTSLPAEIGRLTQLTSLDLHRNKLVSIPGWIVSGRILRRPRLDLGTLRIYDSLVPALRSLDFLARLGGLSLIACAEKR